MFVAGQPNAELLMRARSIGASFPACAVAMPAGGGVLVSPRQTWAQGFRLLLGVSATALRTASYLARVGGVFPALYGVFALLVWVFKSDIEKGWTTLSLQIAAMMFLFSVMFLFLTEYVIQIHAANPPRSRRQLVVRELCSPLSRRLGGLDLVEGGGAVRDLPDRSPAGAVRPRAAQECAV